MKNKNLKIFSGRSNINLATDIAKSLKQDLGSISIRTFSDGELWVKYKENIRGCDVFIIQSTNPPTTNIWELLLILDAAKRASAKSVGPILTLPLFYHFLHCPLRDIILFLIAWARNIK